MNTFEEYQAIAAKVPLSLRNNLDRINLPLLGMQQETGKIGALLATSTTCGKLVLGEEQRGELQERLGEILWCVALLCGEVGIPMREVAMHSARQLQIRAASIDPERR
jgi:hypothetical protein